MMSSNMTEIEGRYFMLSYENGRNFSRVPNKDNIVIFAWKNAWSEEQIKEIWWVVQGWRELHAEIGKQGHSVV